MLQVAFKEFENLKKKISGIGGDEEDMKELVEMICNAFDGADMSKKVESGAKIKKKEECVVVSKELVELLLK